MKRSLGCRRLDLFYLNATSDTSICCSSEKSRVGWFCGCDFTGDLDKRKVHLSVLFLDV